MNSTIENTTLLTVWPTTAASINITVLPGNGVNTLLAIGFGGGGFMLLILLVVVLICLLKNRKRKRTTSLKAAPSVSQLEECRIRCRQRSVDTLNHALDPNPYITHTSAGTKSQIQENTKTTERQCSLERLTDQDRDGVASESVYLRMSTATLAKPSPALTALVSQRSYENVNDWLNKDNKSEKLELQKKCSATSNQSDSYDFTSDWTTNCNEAQDGKLQTHTSVVSDSYEVWQQSGAHG